MISKYRACLVGGVIGDCLGSPFEGESRVLPKTLNKFLASIDERKNQAVLLRYTDDTAMARKVAQSLIAKQGVDKKHLASEFTKEYFEEPQRGYGGNVIYVFNALKEERFEDPTGPSKRQFNGTGSYGNGSAMRIAPGALFGEKHDIPAFNELITDISMITHSHKDGINGAILLAEAIRFALALNPDDRLDYSAFIDHLHSHMINLEPKTLSANKEDNNKAESYCKKLEIMKELLEKSEITIEEVVNILGNNISALGSVPAAIFTFLRTHKYPKEIKRNSPFEKTIMSCILLGGDTDTIASMAGALAGAYYGMDVIDQKWQDACESVDEAKGYAQHIYDINYPEQVETSV